MPRSQAERLWLVGGVLSALVMLVVGYFFFIGPQRSHTGDVRGEVDTAQLQNLSLQQRINTLRAQDKNRARYLSALHQAQRALPQTSGLPDFLRSLQSIGSATLTEVSSVTVGQPTAPSTAPSATAPQASASGATGSPSPSPSATQPAAAGGGVYSIPISAQVSGSKAALNRFLTQLQSVQPRAVLITQLSLDSGAGSAASTTTLSLTMQAFVQPGADSPAPQPTTATQP